MALLERLNTEKEIAPIVAQFVPIKLDVDTDEYRQWQQDHAAEGNTIPKLFVVRGDGETLYGRSGSLQGDALPSMLLQALQRSGKILSPKDAITLKTTADRFEELRDSGDIAGAIKSLSKVRSIGDPGKIPSYADSATKLNELVNQMTDEVKTRLKDLAVRLENDDTPDRLAAILDYQQIRRDYGSLKPLRSDLSSFQKEMFANSAYGQLAREAQILDAAKTAKTKSAKTRAAGKLRDLITKTEIDEVKSAAEALLGELESDGQ